MAQRADDKRRAPLQISFRLFDYLTDATIKSSPIDHGDSPVYISRVDAVFRDFARKSCLVSLTLDPISSLFSLQLLTSVTAFLRG